MSGINPDRRSHAGQSLQTFVDFFLAGSTSDACRRALAGRANGRDVTGQVEARHPAALTGEFCGATFLDGPHAAFQFFHVGHRSFSPLPRLVVRLLDSCHAPTTAVRASSATPSLREL